MGEFSVRRAAASDAATLALVGAAAFLETYAHMLPGKDLIEHVASKHSAEFYARCLADPAAIVWLAESTTCCPIGYLVLTPATLPVGAADPRDMEIQRIYVLSRYHRSGLGYALMKLALDKATETGARRVVLGVHNDNTRALAFYARQGFAPIDSRTFHVGATVCCDSVLARAPG